jgi:hypothetical protein
MIEIIILLAWVLAICLIAYVAFWIIDSIGIPSPMNWIIKAIAALILLVVLLSKLGVGIGGLT